MKYTPNGQHTPSLIRKIFKILTMGVIARLNRFGTKSGLFDELKIVPFANNEESPFEIHICKNKTNYPKLSNMGYGLSQILPLVVELLLRTGSIHFCIQQPEVHLHPKAQAAFGDLLYDVVIGSSNRLFVETHSDYVIDQFRLRMAQFGDPYVQTKVLYFEKVLGQNKVHTIDIDQKGCYSEKQPKSLDNSSLKRN